MTVRPGRERAIRPATPAAHAGGAESTPQAPSPAFRERPGPRRRGDLRRHAHHALRAGASVPGRDLRRGPLLQVFAKVTPTPRRTRPRAASTPERSARCRIPAATRCTTAGVPAAAGWRAIRTAPAPSAPAPARGRPATTASEQRIACPAMAVLASSSLLAWLRRIRARSCATRRSTAVWRAYAQRTAHSATASSVQTDPPASPKRRGRVPCISYRRRSRRRTIRPMGSKPKASATPIPSDERSETLLFRSLCRAAICRPCS